MKLGALKGKLPEELGPVGGEAAAEGESPEMEMEDVMPEESAEPVDLAGIPDDALLEEVKKRNLI
jgi:hypothetical protein